MGQTTQVELQGGTDPEESRASHSDDGVDLTLIRWMLGLTPTERLEVLQSQMDAIAELRNAARGG